MSYYDGLALRLSKIRPKADDKSIQRCLRRAFACKKGTMDVNGRWLDGVIKEVIEEAITKPPLDVFAVHAQRLKEIYYDNGDVWVPITPSNMISLLNMIIFHRCQNNIEVKGLDIEKLRSLTMAIPDLQAICKIQVHIDALMKPQPGDQFCDENEWIREQKRQLDRWEELREEVLNSGVKFSSMVAVMPETDPPRLMTAHTDGIYPIRRFIHPKSLECKE